MPDQYRVNVLTRDKKTTASDHIKFYALIMQLHLRSCHITE